MPDTFYPGQPDYIEKLNELASVQDLINLSDALEDLDNISAGVSAAAAEAANSASLASSYSSTAQDAVIEANAAVTEASNNAAAAAASAAAAAAVSGSFIGTSTSSLSIGNGNKTFITQVGESYTAGIFMTAVSASNTAKWMFGQVVSYSGTTLILDVSIFGESGTANDWNLSLAGSPGTAGPPGPAGSAEQVILATGSVDTITATYSPVISSLTNYLLLSFISIGENTSATPTFSPNGLTPRTITTRGGLPLSPGEIGPAGFVAKLEYNQPNSRWELINPVYYGTKSRLDLKAPIESPTFTGTVSGISKSMVGLGSVDNTPDSSKPVSTAQQEALDLKAPLASPVFTGLPKSPNIAHTTVDKGSVGTGTVTFDVQAGFDQRLQVTGPLTYAFSNWPAAGVEVGIKIKMVNWGSSVVAPPTINWQLPAGGFTTSFSTYLTAIGRTALQSAGIDFGVFWSNDAGTTIYGKLV